MSPRRAVTVAAALAAVASVSARCTAVSPRVTIVALARDGVGDPPYPAGEVVSESGVHPSPCAEWILNPSSQGYWELEVHAVTTQHASQRVTAALRKMPGIIRVSVQPLTVFDEITAPKEWRLNPVRMSRCATAFTPVVVEAPHVPPAIDKPHG